MRKTRNDNDEISALEAAKMLQVHPGTLANWRHLGVGPEYRKLSDSSTGRVVYSREVIRDFRRQMTHRTARR